MLIQTVNCTNSLSGTSPPCKGGGLGINAQGVQDVGLRVLTL